MSLAKLKAAIEQAESLTTRIDQLQRIRALIGPEFDAHIAPGHLPKEIAKLPAGIAKQTINDEVDRLSTRLAEIIAKINQAGTVLP